MRKLPKLLIILFSALLFSSALAANTNNSTDPDTAFAKPKSAMDPGTTTEAASKTTGVSSITPAAIKNQNSKANDPTTSVDHTSPTNPASPVLTDDDLISVLANLAEQQNNAISDHDRICFTVITSYMTDVSGIDRGSITMGDACNIIIHRIRAPINACNLPMPVATYTDQTISANTPNCKLYAFQLQDYSNKALGEGYPSNVNYIRNTIVPPILRLQARIAIACGCKNII